MNKVHSNHSIKISINGFNVAIYLQIFKLSLFRESRSNRRKSSKRIKYMKTKLKVKNTRMNHKLKWSLGNTELIIPKRKIIQLNTKCKNIAEKMMHSWNLNKGQLSNKHWRHIINIKTPTKNNKIETNRSILTWLKQQLS